MSENAPSPTPSQDNMYNEHNVVINKALDHVLSVQPQSYDDFMNGFTYLTKDDVKKKISINQSGLQVEVKATAKVNGRGQLGTNNESKIATSKSERISSSLQTNMSAPDGRESQNIPNLESEDDLDEEVLTEGTKTSIMSKEVGATVTGQLKFDNFVDNCSDSEEDDISKGEEENENSGGYVASFAHIDSKTEDDVKKKISINQSGLQVEVKATAKVNGRGQLGTNNESKIATSKSERISSSLQTNMAAPDGRESQNIPNLESEDDLDEEVLTEGTKTSIMSKEVGATVTGQLKFDNFVDNCSDSEEDDISKGEEENENSGGYVASFAHIDSKTEGKEDKGQTFQSEAELSSSVCETEECTGQENCLNPGEIEDIQDTPTVQDILKDTKLDFSAQFKTAKEINNSTSDQVCSDEVEPFTLDEDFDYDNVKLTPKYSVEDLQLMKTLREQNQQYTD